MSGDLSKMKLRLPTLTKEVLKKGKFGKWRTQAWSIANAGGYQAALEEGAEKHLPDYQVAFVDMPSATPSDIKAANRVKMNSMAMAMLNLAVVPESAARCITRGRTEKWPDGIASLAWKRLTNKFTEEGMMGIAELRRQLEKIKMNGKGDVVKLFDEVYSIETAAREIKDGTIEPEELLNKVVMEAFKHRDYMLSVKMLVKEKKLAAEALDIEQVEEQMMEIYKISRFNREDDSDSDSDADGTEKAMYAGGEGSSKFNGKCYNCGKEGHRANKCTAEKKKGGQGGSYKGTEKGRFSGECFKCGKVGHMKADCWKGKGKKQTEMANKAADKDKEESSDEEFMMKTSDKVTFPDKASMLQDPNIMIADTGATCDSSPWMNGMTELRDPKSSDVMVAATGEDMVPRKIGDMVVEQHDKNGIKVQKIKLMDVTVTQKGSYSLFSISKRLKEGWTLVGDKKKIELQKDGKKLTFDIVINTPKGALFCAYMKRSDRTETALVTRDSTMVKTQKIPIRVAHTIMGHMGEAGTRESVKNMGYEVAKGTLQPCEGCAIGKAKQKSVTKRSAHVPATENNERVFVDIATIVKPGGKDKKEDKTTRNNWLMVVDERTKFKTSAFYDTKSGMIEPTCAQFEKNRYEGKPVKFVRCDNAGENIKLEKIANGKGWKLNLTFEYTGKETPQRNHLVELGFATISGRSRAMLSAARIPLELRYKVSKEALRTATMLDGLAIIDIDGRKKSRYEHFNEDYEHHSGGLPQWTTNMRTFGEAGVVKTRKVNTPKIYDRGVTCMFVGYNDKAGNDVHRMWNPQTNRVHNTRDIVWMKKLFYDKVVDDSSYYDGDIRVGRDKGKETADDGSDYESDDDLVSLPAIMNNESASDDEEDEEDEKDEELKTTRSGRKVRTPDRYKELANLQMTQHEASYLAAMMTVSVLQTDGKEAQAIEHVRNQEYACVGAGLGGGFQNTSELHVMKYEEAMASGDKVEWEKAVAEERRKMEEYKVWTPRKLSDLPHNAKFITSTWAMKKKANGTYRARMNARGYEQVEGLHYDPANIAAPVTNEMSIRIVMVLTLMAVWTAQIVDVKGAFLHGEFDENAEKLYLRPPKGFQHIYGSDVVLLLLKTIYGLKNAAKAFWRELLRAFSAMECKRSDADPCMYFKWTESDGLLIWLSWIDDCVCFGKDVAVEESKSEMKKLFECEDIGDLNEYVGCKISRNDGFTFTQPVMLQSFKDEFDLPDRDQKVPALAGVTLTKATDENELSPKETTYFRKGVGKLLHMMRWSRPEVCNSVRDLSRHMSKVAQEHVDAMHRVMSNCAAYPERGWNLKPERKWDGKDRDFKFVINGRSDSDYASCKATRRSVSGWAVYLEGAPISAKSSMQKTVALSVTEAELMAAVSCAQDMMYAKRILESLGLQVQLPMILEIDNKGTVDLINNWSVGGRTRHVETRQLFLRGLKEQGIFTVQWIAGAENEVDIFTKNLPNKLFEKHRVMFNGDDNGDDEG